MYFQHTIFSLIFLPGIATAADWTWAGHGSSWFAEHSSNEASAVQAAYSSCRQLEANEQQNFTGEDCVHHAISLIMEGFGAAFGGGYIEEAIGFGDPATIQSPSRVRRSQRQASNTALIDHFNQRSKLDGVRALEVVESHIHLLNGLAIRLNVQGDGSTLHFHTNGSHALALFDEDTESRQRSTGERQFHFNGLNDLKMQVHSINQPMDWGTDIDEFVKQWTVTNQQSGKAVLRQSDTWRFEACNQKKTASFFYGMLSTGDERATSYYEPIEPPNCR